MGATGQWQALASDVDFADNTQANTVATISFEEGEIEKTASLQWTETVTTTEGFECSDSDEVQIKFIKKPTLAINSTMNQEICEDKTTTIDLTLKGHSPFNLTYEIDGNKKTIPLTSTGTNLTFQRPELSLENNTINFSEIEDNYGCITNIDLSQDVWVYEMPTANAGPDIDTCGLSVDLLAVQQYEDSKWLYSQGTFDDIRNPHAQFTANNTGTLDLIWKETNGSCTDTDTVKVSFFGTPYPVKEVTDTVIYASKYIILPADSLQVGTGQWSIIEPAVSGAIFEDASLYRSKFYNFNTGEYYHLQWKATLASAPEACREKTHNVYIKTNSLLAPTGISPNDDGANDVLKIMGAENIPNNKLSIFDKNGKQVISITNYGAWDQSKGEFKRWPDKKLGMKFQSREYIFMYLKEMASPQSKTISQSNTRFTQATQ
ncbi:T9SS type B sorting domain-containing protein [Saccharicrinis fermentans]|uniref:T9SS type B sorting domain-containing protein n=1 Tax=Saccharicrinis fermentans TaxID=982 RepID=UPI001267A04A|nr:gliding motility-associated C-terminal domain-containing protein [Saccharicrinis fermentans]